MVSLHPTFAVRDQALRAHVAAVGGRVGHTGTCRSLATQIRLRREKPHLAADPYRVGSVTPMGFRIAGSLHMEQADGYCHAIDYNISGITWSRFHAIAESYGVGFPMKHRSPNPEPWHGQWFTGSRIYPAPALDTREAASEPVLTPSAEEDDDMMLWTTHENSGNVVNYLFVGDKHVMSLHRFDGNAMELARQGVKHFGHVDETGHNVLMARCLGQPDPDTGLVGTWSG